MTDFGPQGPFARGDRLLEQYQVVQLLGIGGHAYVYECRDLFLDELLAVKVIPNPANRGRDLLDRARAEAQLLRRLSHPNVVRMHTAAALGEDMVCLVMEKLVGVTLRHLLALLQRLSVVEAATIVRQVAIGVAAAHALNVVHRDIKPDNVFVLPPNNHVKVLDFGIAKFLGHGLQTSNKYRFQGTPLYMSPEHLKGAGVTVRSDVYQLGTVLFELVAGINPNLLELDNPGFEQVAFVQITRPTPSLTKVVPDVPASLDWLVQKATAKDPAERFATMTEFVEALDRTLDDYLSMHPAAANRIRTVDEVLMRAASELAAREAEPPIVAPPETNRAAAHGHTSNRPLEPAGMHSSAPPAPAAAERLELPRQDERMASFHPVPQALGQDRIPIPKLGATGAGAVAKAKPISIMFVLAALGFGVVVGLLFLWLVPRGNAGTAAMPSGSVAGAALTARPEYVSTPPASMQPLATDAAVVAPVARHVPARPNTGSHRSDKPEPTAAAGVSAAPAIVPEPAAPWMAEPVPTRAPADTNTKREHRRVITNSVGNEVPRTR
jgi:serine/threonine protein kinase